MKRILLSLLFVVTVITAYTQQNTQPRPWTMYGVDNGYDPEEKEIDYKSPEMKEYFQKKAECLMIIKKAVIDFDSHNCLFETEKDSTERVLIGFRNKISDLMFTNYLE